MPDTSHSLMVAATELAPLRRIELRDFILCLNVPVGRDGGGAKLLRQAEALGFDPAFAPVQCGAALPTVALAIVGSVEDIARVKAQAAEHGRQVKCIVSLHVVCRDSEAAARQYLQRILDSEEDEAVDSFIASIGVTTAERPRIVGSPQQVVDWMLELQAVGCDGVQINFFDFEPDLEQFGGSVLPLLRQAGLRKRNK